jgi:hypothetical protein
LNPLENEAVDVELMRAHVVLMVES